MGNHAAAVRLAHRPSKIGPLSDHAIRYLVDSFYAKVRADSELGPIFKRAIPGDWGPHLATMHDFWSSIMLTSGRYKGNPIAVHLRVEGMEPQLFGRWLALFAETCRELFDDDVAGVFRAKAERMLKASSLLCSIDPTGRGRGAHRGSRERLSHDTMHDLQLLHASSWSNRNEEDK
jgi:hemoglobin